MMNQWVRRGLTVSMVVGAIGVGASACADNESSVFIRQVLVPSSSDCSYTGDPGAAHYTYGAIDLAFTRQYTAGLLIGNQLVERGSTDLLRAESSRFRAEGAEVEIETTGGDLLQSFTVPVSGFADPGSGSSPGWGIVSAVLIDSETANGLASSFSEGVASDMVGRVVAVVRVYGRTLGGQEVETGDFRFPIDICYGCLVSFPPEATDANLPTPNCENVSESGVDTPCYMGQDEFIDCRLCKSMGYGTLCDP